jgi:hypothetical protein
MEAELEEKDAILLAVVGLLEENKRLMDRAQVLMATQTPPIVVVPGT